MLKYDFNKIAKQINLKFAAYFQNTFGGQILKKYGYEYTGF